MNLLKMFKRSTTDDVWPEENEELEDEEYDGLGVPVGCSACGGDYPYCKDSCPMFDD